VQLAPCEDTCEAIVVNSLRYEPIETEHVVGVATLPSQGSAHLQEEDTVCDEGGAVRHACSEANERGLANALVAQYEHRAGVRVADLNSHGMVTSTTKKS